MASSCFAIEHNALTLPGLSRAQRDQIDRQVNYHLSAPPVETVALADGLILRLLIQAGVTRPMSSKGLASWLWKSQHLVRGRRVLDIGTGTGVQGITCVLGGAQQVVMSDFTDSSTECARVNLFRTGLAERATVIKSDLFDGIAPSVFDLIVFAQPYFSGVPLSGRGCTRGMLADESLLPKFFGDVRRFLSPDGVVVMMDWPFASQANRASLVGRTAGLSIDSQIDFECSEGIQSGRFEIVVLKR